MKLAHALAACLLVLAGTAEAQTRARSPITAALNLGTPGAGVEAQLSLGPVFVLRGGIDTLGYDVDQSFDDIDYSGRFDFDTVSAFVDVHPFANAFLISGGVYVGDRTIGLNARPTVPLDIGGQTFTPGQIGTLSGAIKLSDVAPFLGVGFDDAFIRESRWGFRAIAGVAWSEAPEVGLTSTGGSLSNDPNFRARLEQEARDISKEAEDKGIFPVVQLGATVRF
jgi:hypothetical protein